MLFVMLWGDLSQSHDSHPVISEYGDYLQYLFVKLISKSRTDPFKISDKVLIYGSTSCEYLVCKFPGILGQYFVDDKFEDNEEKTAPLALELILSHKECVVSWSSVQLEEICSIGPNRIGTNIQDVPSHLSF
jgi:hypothetical protein